MCQASGFRYFQNGTARTAPAMGAIIYTHMCSKWPDTTAGPIDLAVFMEAPQTGPANMASKPTTAPMACGFYFSENLTK